KSVLDRIRPLGDESAAYLKERFRAGGVQREVVEPPTLEDLLTARYQARRNLERVQDGVRADLDEGVAPTVVLSVERDAGVDGALVEGDQPIEVGREERHVVEVGYEAAQGILLVGAATIA